MRKFDPVTYFFKRPIAVMVRDNDRTATWTLSEVTFDFLREGQVRPSDGLVFNCHHALRDADDEEIPVEVLSLLDLEGGLREAMREGYSAAWSASEAAR